MYSRAGKYTANQFLCFADGNQLVPITRDEFEDEFEQMIFKEKQELWLNQ